MAEWIKIFLVFQISWYFFICHSLLKRCFQKGQVFELAWWLLLQFKQLNECEYSLLYLVLSLGGLVLKFAVQHQVKWQWCLVLWGLLHLVYFNSWIWQVKVMCPHFQQFLYWRILLWNAVDMNNFYFIFILFSDFIGILFSFSFSFLLNDEEVCDIAVTWHVTWCDVIGLEGGGRI